MTEGSCPPARVGIDCRCLERGPSGVTTYVRNLLERLPILDCLGGGFPPNNFLWNQLRVPAAASLRGWRLFHAPGYTAPLLSFCPVVLSVHDVSYLVSSHLYPYRLDALRLQYYRSSLRRASRILVPTAFSARELSRLMPRLEGRIRCISLGVSGEFRRRAELAEATRRDLELPDRFVLHVGHIHPRRNLKMLVEACRRAGLPLVLVGRILKGGEEFSGYPLLFSDLDQQRLLGLYSAATVFAYPSLYEGFGLPVLEAMACGLPVVAARASCLPEVCGEAALLVPPDERSFERGIREVLSSPQEWVEKGLRRAASFTWDSTARQTLQVYQELADLGTVTAVSSSPDGSDSVSHSGDRP